MYVANPGSPTGWPWPLDLCQNWFEALWDQVVGIAEAAAKWVWNITPKWLKDPIAALKGWLDGLWISVRDHIGWWDPVHGRFVGGFLGWLWDTLTLLGTMIADAAGWTWDQIKPIVIDIAGAFGSLMSWIWTKLVDIGTWITGKIWGWVDGSLRWLTDTFTWLRNEVADTGAWTVNQMVTAFDGAVGGIVGVFTGWPGLLTTAISAIFEPLFLSLGAIPITSSSPGFGYGDR